MARARKANENDFATFVLGLASYTGWRTAHFRPAQTSKGWRTPVQGDGAGFPDLVLVRRERLIFAELKSDVGKLRPEQKHWLRDLEFVEHSIADSPETPNGSVEVYLWRPGDVEKIREVLR